MSELVERARIYATNAHQRINHMRKYTGQPYDAHLDEVAKLVATVSDDAEMIAAAWLHDTVEDTPATLEDIEAEFGVAVAELVEELTDVSKQGDGNRAVRKEIDRIHLKQASARAKTVKLADLIDNCRDITKHDPRFARVYLIEMNALLGILYDGDGQLLITAQKTYQRSIARLGLDQQDKDDEGSALNQATPMKELTSPQFRRMFTELFTAEDISEPMLSFGVKQDCPTAREAMDVQRRDVASVRVRGTVQGYMRRSDLDVEGRDDCGDCIRHFAVDQVVTGNSTLADVIHVLTRHDYCFVSLLGEVSGVIVRDDINKPVVRMWLFGMITMLEMGMGSMIQSNFPNDCWVSRLSSGRLEKIRELQAERLRRHQHCELVDCLQLSDKGHILSSEESTRLMFGFTSRRAAKGVVREFESLRNNLAHAQDVVIHDWAQIARMSKRMEAVALYGGAEDE